MVGNLRLWLTGCGVALALLAVVSPVGAQGLLDWRPRTQLRPDALATGAAAAFWNPAALRPPTRAELFAADLDAPTGLRGIAIAGALAATARGALAVGYQNLRLEDVDRTSTSPLPDPGGAGLDLSEHQLTLGTAWALTTSLSAGLGARYVRSADVLGGGSRAGAAGGAVYEAGGRLAPRLGGVAGVDADGIVWSVGGEIAPALADDGTHAVLGYGVDSEAATGLTHRLAAGLTWRGFAGFTAALLGEPQSTGTSWQPAAEAHVQVRRYGLGFTHERLPSGFGGVNTFRLSVRF